MTEVPTRDESSVRAREDILRIYPMPVEEDAAADYLLTVGGQPAPACPARVSAHPLNQVWPGYQRPKSQTEIASFASWDMDAPVEVVVKSERPVQTVRVRPQAAGIVPQVEGDTIRFTVAKPGQYTVEVNGAHRALHLFANPLEEASPDPRDPNVLYFGPGVQCPGLMRVKSGQTVYIAGGAVVYGAILAEKAENICIRGRGILDGSRIDRLDGLTALVCLYDCGNVRIEGVTLRDSPVFTVVPLASRQVNIRNVKVIGNWRYNSDGLNFISCRDGRVEDCFIRSFDDCVCIKGYEMFGSLVYRLQLVNGQWDGFFTVDGGVTRRSFADLVRSYGVYPCQADSIHDIQIRRCVLWNDWGRALEVGAETAADEIRDIVFEDCDVIHASDVAMDVQNCDRALVRNVVFRGIRVEMDDAPMRPVGQQHQDQVYAEPANGYLPTLLALGIQKGYCSFDAERGRIEGIRFESIDVTAPRMPPSRLSGHDAGHLVQGVSIANLRLNGRAATDPAAGGIAMNEFTRDVTLRAGAPRILFLGNSITFHPPKPEIGWAGNWGMAASAQDKDYVHLLLQRFAAASGGVAPEARAENIAAFEREYGTYDFGARLEEFIQFKADILVLAIGENVPSLAAAADQTRFRNAVVALLARITQDHRPALFVRGPFWPDPVKESVLRQICQETGGTYVDISALGAVEANYARSKRPFQDGGVAIHPGDRGMAAIHPGDRGMAAIAEAIWRAMARSSITN